MAQVKAQLSDKEKEAWKQFCEINNATESQMLRMMIGRVSEGIIDDAGDTYKPDPKSGKITIRLSATNQNKLTKRAKLDGYPNRTKWATAVVLAALHKEPVLSEGEISALRESNRELAAIGRNLNQIARALNIEFRDGDRFKMEAVQALVDRIEKHKDKVASLLNKNMNRWNCDE